MDRGHSEHAGAQLRAGPLCLGVLGPLRAWRRAAVPIGGPMQRAVLGLLALYPESGLRRTAIIDALWGDDPPATAVAMIQAYVSRLRYLLDDGAPETLLIATAGRYQLNTAGCDLDQVAFAARASQARDSHAAGDLAGACDGYAHALGLWRGEPLSDLEALRDHPAITRLNLQRAEAVTGYAEAAAAAGQHHRVLEPLLELTGREPLNERAHAQLMIALAGSGQQAAALRLYEALRRRLDGQLGVRPGAELADARARVLRQDVRGDHPGHTAGPGTPPRARRGGEAPWPAIAQQLPAPAVHFAGRAGELAALARLPGQAAPGRPGAVVISAIDGMAGVGKTTLAVQAGHLLASRFPDRQLFVDLHGHTPGQPPADPASVLAGLLAADGVDPRYLPGDLDGRAAMWRDRVAGQRVLLILDNAASSAQVTPLLPGAPGSMVLVTSRRFLGDLPAAIMDVALDVLPPADAAAMFTGLAPRAAGEPGRVAEVVALCGHLPLAIALLARLFTRHRSWTMADLIAGTRARLLTVTAENRTIAAAFELSYKDLDPARQGFFRRLGLHPGSEIEPYAAAALAGLPLDQAVTHLDGLLGERLLEEPVPHRYRMHDLIRQYARGLAVSEPEAAREQSIRRLLGYYHYTTQAASTYLIRYSWAAVSRPSPPATGHPELADRDQALAWLSAERANVLACIDGAAAAGRRQVIGLTAAIAPHLRSDGPWPLAVTLHTVAARAARGLGDRRGEANALTDLGETWRLTGDYRAAAGVLEQAGQLSRAIGDRRGQANVLLNLGLVWQLTDDRPAAATALEQALAIYRETGDQLGETNTLLNLGDVRRVANDYPAAADALERALEIYRTVGDRPGEANAYFYLAVVRHMTGDLQGTTSLLNEALARSRGVRSRIIEANALYWLGDVRRLAGDLPGAEVALGQALESYRTIGSRLGEANARYGIASVRWATGRPAEVAELLDQAMDIYGEIGDRLGQANVRCRRAEVLQAAGDFPAAAGLLSEALDVYGEVDDGLGQAEALNQAGALELAREHPRPARSQHRKALELACALGSQLEEARALEGLARCAAKLAVNGTGHGLLRQALEIYQRIGAGDRIRLAAELDDAPAMSLFR
jgi:DNA-binding SARP family transcriptional activator/tetratricopeptide (TPR) repeat protein